MKKNRIEKKKRNLYMLHAGKYFYACSVKSEGVMLILLQMIITSVI